MALPTKEKTWNYHFETWASIARNTWAQQVIYAWKEEWTTQGNNPWSVHYSCDSVVAGTDGDGVDRWAAPANVVWSTGNHSWIVLRNVDGLELLFDLDFNNQGQGLGYISPSAGFTGGTISARPTATDEFEITFNVNSHYSSSRTDPVTPGAAWYEQSDDGTMSRVFWFTSSNCHAAWFVEKFKNPLSTLTIPYCFILNAEQSEATPLIDATMMTTDQFYMVVGSSDFITSKLTQEGIHNTGALHETPQGQFAEETTGELYFIEQGIFHTATVGFRGPKAERFDAWYGQNPPATTGDTYPNDSSRQFVQIGDHVYPHDGSIPIVS